MNVSAIFIDDLVKFTLVNLFILYDGDLEKLLYSAGLIFKVLLL